MLGLQRRTPLGTLSAATFNFVGRISRRRHAPLHVADVEDSKKVRDASLMHRTRACAPYGLRLDLDAPSTMRCWDGNGEHTSRNEPAPFPLFSNHMTATRAPTRSPLIQPFKKRGSHRKAKSRRRQRFSLRIPYLACNFRNPQSQRSSNQQRTQHYDGGLKI